MISKQKLTYLWLNFGKTEWLWVVGPPLEPVFFHFWMYIPGKTSLQSGCPSGLTVSRWQMAIVTRRTFHNLILCGSCLPPGWYLLSGLLYG